MTQQIQDLDEALFLFEEAAINHGHASEKGDYKFGNRNCEIIFEVIQFLKKNNKIISLMIFLDHPSDSVKSWAASYLLPLKESEAVNTLQEISKGKGIIAFSAGITLKEWRKGTLGLFYGEND